MTPAHENGSYVHPERIVRAFRKAGVEPPHAEAVTQQGFSSQQMAILKQHYDYSDE